MRDCVKCGAPVDGDVCPDCGFGGKTSDLPVQDRNANRCAWQANGERCRYPGTMSHGTLGQEPWYCSGHIRCHDQERGAAIVAESMKAWPDGADYTTAALVELTRRRFLAGAVQREPGQEG